MSKFTGLVFLAVTWLMMACNDQDIPAHGISTPHLENLQGTWTLSHETMEVIENMASDNWGPAEWGPPKLRMEPLHLRIEDNSMQVFQYPLEYLGTFELGLKGNKPVKGSNSRKSDALPRNVESIHVGQDSLFRTVVRGQYWITSHYFRDSLNADTLALLVRDSVLAAALQGKWGLDTVVSGDYEADFVIDLPFEIPDSLFFSQNDGHDTKGKITSIKVDSTLRPFRYGFVNKHRIWLKPAGWFSEGLPPIEYDRGYFISLLGRKGIGKVEEVKRMEIAYAANIGMLLGDEESERTVKTTDNPAEISQFMDLLLQLPYKGTGQEYRDRPDNLPSWRIRFVDHNDLWYNVLFIGRKIETSTGSPGEYYADRKNIELETAVYALMQAFMSTKE